MGKGTDFLVGFVFLLGSVFFSWAIMLCDGRACAPFFGGVFLWLTSLRFSD